MHAEMGRDVGRLIEIFHGTGAIQYAEPGKPFVFASKRKSNNKIVADTVLKNKEGAEIVGLIISSQNSSLKFMRILSKPELKNFIWQ